MRIVSWNIRAGGGKRAAAIARQLRRWKPDLICLNEFRATPPSQQLADDLREAGFVHQLSSSDPKQPATNALLLASRVQLKPLNLKRMPDNPHRWMIARVSWQPSVVLGAMHIPNYTHPHLKYPYLDSVVDTIRHWRCGPALLIGDTNCGKRGIDEEQYSAALFRREHDWMESVEASGWSDGFRQIHGLKREFTWYSHRDNGFRLDHAFLNPALAHALMKVRHVWGKDKRHGHRRDALSDHAALIVDLNL